MAITYDIEFSAVVKAWKNKALPITRSMGVLRVSALDARIGVYFSFGFAFHILIVSE
jgi:hypothetical protein